VEKFDLPKAFEARMRDTLGAEYDAFRQSLELPSPVSVRINPKKNFQVPANFRVPWCSHGYYLAERPVFTLDPHLHAGAYYVQEACSMFLEQAVRHAVDLSKSIRVLDLCAAPGGKSTHLLSLLNETSLLVSNEVIRSRASILSENIQKWGYANVVVTNSDPQNFQNLTGFFDLIVVDAPCSGEGLFRKEPEATREWSEENVNLCALRQRRIVSDVWPALKQDGILIYSTCTYNEQENEENLKWLAANNEVQFIELATIPDGVRQIKNNGVVGYRLLPHRVQGEGFFLAAIRKKGEEPPSPFKFKKENSSQSTNKEVLHWLSGDFNTIQQNDLLIGWPRLFTEDIDRLAKHLTIITKGLAIATVKQNKLVPEHALALSIHLNKEQFPAIEVTRDEALAYLRKETLLPFNGERGFALIQFEGNALGWINRLGNRINNLYPLNWRIRMGSH
jgi:16S rRNA C967 or C1407 C5-methylase (RsmB/RsmF family)/NOL1/NOP2/fmu family ribosome biogenesis protein